MWRSNVSVGLSGGMILLKGEVVPGVVLEQERPNFPVGLACYDDKRRGEFQNLKLAGQLRRIPHLSIADLKRLTVCRVSVDCDQERASCLFSWIIHLSSCSIAAKEDALHGILPIPAKLLVFRRQEAGLRVHQRMQ